ncbi:MAG TPA: TPM domain-containing protein [Bacteroidales bacterium]|nr:TPM domain-containing protein [Bacteroidales bacterium]HPT13022.1 TPM domain-containing protein [Bacteroidales bacterium]
MKASAFFTPLQQESIVNAIEEAEKATSGEIRVHIETTCKGDVLDRSAWLFNKLGMSKTAEHNGVLFYLAVGDRKFAIIGDSGINSVVPAGFWDEVRDHMEKRFRDGLFTEGLSEGIIMAGNQLKEHFPYTSADVNELPDTISFDNTETGEIL